MASIIAVLTSGNRGFADIWSKLITFIMTYLTFSAVGLMLVFKTRLTGITKFCVLLDLDVTVRAITFFTVSMFMLFFADGLRTHDAGHSVLIIFDGQM
jgi:hypothetical protein